MKFPDPLPQSQYGDPANNVKYDRETCKDCRFERINLDGAKWCIKINRKWGKRCKEYAK